MRADSRIDNRAGLSGGRKKFYFTFEDERVFTKARRGFYTKMDLGIVKYYFEAVTGLKVE